jgi:hypothetical protein
MTHTASRRLLAAGSFLLCGTLLANAADPPAAPAKRDQWEVVSQMGMDGLPMPMPPQKVVVCAPKEWKEPPGGNDERRKCKVSDFKLDGPKATWKVHCEGPPAMDGEGEITRTGPEAFTGSIKFTSTEAAMTVKLTGKRLGDCDLK